MKRFRTIVQEQGIEIPVVPERCNPIKRAWLNRKAEKFERDFLQAERDYYYLLSRLERRRREWEYYNAILKNEWEREYNIPTEVPLSFQTMREAIEVIADQMAEFQNERPEKLFKNVEFAYRADWVQELVDAAPSDCRLIVIRDKEYYPCEDEAKRFHAMVEDGKETQVAEIFSICWVAFDPKKTIDITYWEMTKTKSEVEYIF